MSFVWPEKLKFQIYLPKLRICNESYNNLTTDFYFGCIIQFLPKKFLKNVAVFLYLQGKKATKSKLYIISIIDLYNLIPEISVIPILYLLLFIIFSVNNMYLKNLISK